MEEEKTAIKMTVSASLQSNEICLIQILLQEHPFAGGYCLLRIMSCRNNVVQFGHIT